MRILGKGLFSSGYVAYKISTPSKGWTVERRYKEFGELRIELERLHPGYVVPPIYGPSDVDETSSEFIAATRPMLQQFLDDLLRHPLFHCSELVNCFLHNGVRGGRPVDEFYQRVRLYSLMPAPREIEEMKTCDGAATVALPPETKAHVEQLCDSADRLRRLYSEYLPAGNQGEYRILTLNNTMETQIEGLSRTMQRQVALYKEISAQYRLMKQPKMASAINTIEIVFSKIDTSYLQIEKIIGEVFKPLNKQLYHEIGIVGIRVQEIRNMQAQMLAAERRLADRKLDLFSAQEVSKWELAPDCSVSMEVLFTNKAVAVREILPRDSKECAKIRRMHGYMCNKLSEEMDRLCEKDAGQAAFNILFTSKVSRDTAKDVIRFRVTRIHRCT